MEKGCTQVRIVGPLAVHVTGFRASLQERWYAPLTADEQVRLMAHLSRWLASHGLGCAELTDAVAEDFLRARRESGHQHLLSRRALVPLLGYLRAVGAAPVPAAVSSPVDDLIGKFERYLLDERGLVEGTVQGYLRTAGRFREYCAGHGAVDLGAVTAEQISGFVLEEAARRPSGSAKQVVTPLRALLRFTQSLGLTEAELVLAVPAAFHRRLSGLPRPLATEEVARLLASCDRRTAMGRRDYAVLLLLCRLGLRAGEVAALNLDDVDWRAGEIEVHGKGGRRERLPLPQDVGQALAGYLRRGRPEATDRALFVRFCAPRTGVDAGAVSRIVHAAGVRAGVTVTGAHQLRHSAATQLLAAGAPMSEISELLRHRRAATTAIYAKVDHDALRPLARPWPGNAL